jgi:hypothetical protein
LANEQPCLRRICIQAGVKQQEIKRDFFDPSPSYSQQSDTIRKRGRPLGSKTNPEKKRERQLLKVWVYSNWFNLYFPASRQKSRKQFN